MWWKLDGDVRFGVRFGIIFVAILPTAIGAISGSSRIDLCRQFLSMLAKDIQLTGNRLGNMQIRCRRNGENI